MRRFFAKRFGIAFMVGAALVAVSIWALFVFHFPFPMLVLAGIGAADLGYDVEKRWRKRR